LARPDPWEERAGDPLDRQSDPAHPEHEEDQADPAPEGVRVVVCPDEVAGVMEEVERPDREDEDDAARLCVGELHPLPELGPALVEKAELRAELLVGLRLARRLTLERPEGDVPTRLPFAIVNRHGATLQAWRAGCHAGRYDRPSRLNRTH